MKFISKVVFKSDPPVEKILTAFSAVSKTTSFYIAVIFFLSLRLSSHIISGISALWIDAHFQQGSLLVKLTKDALVVLSLVSSGLLIKFTGILVLSSVYALLYIASLAASLEAFQGNLPDESLLRYLRYLPYLLATCVYSGVKISMALICDKLFRSPGLLVFGLAIVIEQILETTADYFLEGMTLLFERLYFGDRKWIFSVYLGPVVALVVVFSLQRKLCLYD